jgi:sugar-specific transcriptional regulator TrmB
MSQPILEKIGLTKREAEAYETLLKLGESPIADILKATNTHPQLIYPAIDSLVKKGLVLVSYRRHRRYVRAEDPAILKKLEEERLKELNETLPYLLSLQSNNKEAIIRVAKGNEAIRTLRAQAIDQLPEGGTYYVISASGDRFYEIMADVYPEVERKRIKKKITKRLISFASQRQLIEQHDTFTTLTERRYLAENNKVPATTVIFNQRVALQIWSQDPIVLTIESPEVAESYRQHFETLWQIAKE